MQVKRIPYSTWSVDDTTDIIALTRKTSTYVGVWQFHTADGWGVVHQGGCYGSMPATHGITTVNKIRILLWDGVDAEWWYDNILDVETSPWKQVLNELSGARIYLLENKSATRYGILEMDVTPDISFRNLMSMMIALRQVVVEPGAIHIIHQLYKGKKATIKDLTFAEVVAISIFTNRNDGKRVLTPSLFVSGNGWMGCTANVSIRHIAQGKFATSGYRIGNGAYYPSDASWGSAPDFTDFSQFLAKGTKVEYEHLFKYQCDGVPFPRQQVKYTVSFEDMLTFARSPITGTVVC